MRQTKPFLIPASSAGRFVTATGRVAKTPPWLQPARSVLLGTQRGALKSLPGLEEGTFFVICCQILLTTLSLPRAPCSRRQTADRLYSLSSVRPQRVSGPWLLACHCRCGVLGQRGSTHLLEASLHPGSLSFSVLQPTWPHLSALEAIPYVHPHPLHFPQSGGRAAVCGCGPEAYEDAPMAPVNSWREGGSLLGVCGASPFPPYTLKPSTRSIDRLCSGRWRGAGEKQ